MIPEGQTQKQIIMLTNSYQKPQRKITRGINVVIFRAVQIYGCFRGPWCLHQQRIRLHGAVT